VNALERADAAWVFPPTPALEDAVLARIARRRRRWPLVAVAFAVLVLAAGAVAGTSLLERLGIGGVELRWVDRLPPAAARRPLAFGDRVSLDEARELAPFVRVPGVDDLDRPTAVYHRRSYGGDMVTFVYEADGRPRLVLSQWRSRASEFRKVLPLSTPVVEVRVDTWPGVWIGGGGHAVWYRALDGSFPRERLALAARTLFWHRAGISYRLEADISQAQALRIAESLR
jgi:hypothetical protein